MLLLNLRTKRFTRTFEESLEELGKSFEEIFEVLGQVLQCYH
jgi:hypothetical protein